MPTIDYDTLAKQAGATGSAPVQPDYDTLAKQAGATGSAPASGPRPGMSDDDIIRMYGYEPATIKKSHLYSSGDFSGYVGKADDNSLPARAAKWLGNSYIGDLGYGALSLANGTAQFVTHTLNKAGIVSDSDKQYVDLMTRLAHDNYVQNTREGHPNHTVETIGQMLAPIPGAGSGVVGAVTAGAAGGAMQPVDVNGPNGDYWAEKGKQIGTGAVVAPVVHGAVKLAGKTTAVILDKAAGKVSAEDQALLDTAQQQGIDGLTYGDVTGNKTGNVVDTTLENIPLTGAGSQRARQQIQVKAAAQRVAGKLQQAMEGTGFEGLDEVATDAKAGDPEAQRVLQMAQQAGSDPDKIMQASLNVRDYLTDKVSRAHYNTVDQIAESLPNNHVEPDQTVMAIDGVLKDIKGSKLDTGEKARMVRMLAGTKDNLTGVNNPYGSMRQLSDELGAQIRGFFQGPNAVIGAPGVGWLQRIKSAVDTDLDEFTRQGVSQNATQAAAPGVSVPGAATGVGSDAGAAQQSAADAEPDSSRPQGTSDPATIVSVPGSSQKYGATYEVRDLGDVQPSHNGQTFSPNPKYGLRNDRNYNNPANQRKVVEWSTPAEFDPAYHITDNPDATNGPPLIDSDGNVLGGNGRTMIMQRVYASNPQGAAAYRQMLEQRAPQFGIDPAEVAGMKQPVLVRVIDDAELASDKAKQDAVTDFNKTGTAALTPAEQAVADARRVSPETLERLSERLAELGPDATTAQAIEGRDGVDIMRSLISDGVIAPQEGARLATEDSLTAAGKQRINQLLLGRFFRDADQLDGLPAAIKNKVERIAGPLARLEAEGDYSLTDHVKSAIDLLETARAKGLNVEDYLDQGGLFNKQKFSPEAQAIAIGLRDGNPTAIATQLNQYAEHARYASAYEGPGLFGELPEPKNPRAAFNHAFGTQLDETAGPAAPEPAEAPKPSEDFDQAFQPTKRPDNPQDQLDRLRAAARAADEYYKSSRVPFKDRGIANATTTDETDRIYDKFIQAGKGDRAQKFYDQLDDKGRAAVRYGMVAKAVDGAIDPSSGVFSPKKFVTALDKTGDARDVFFKGRDKWEMDGFQNLMAHVTRAGQYAENPPTGQRVIPFLMLGGMGGSAAGLAHAAGVPTGVLPVGIVAAARLMFTTARGRDFLLAASSLRPGTRAMDALVNRINAQLPGAAARAITSPGTAAELSAAASSSGAAGETSPSQRNATQ